MPRNAQGVYSLPAGNPVVTNTTIDSTWANPTLSDIANELTASLPRNGVVGMTGPLILDDDATVPLQAVTLQQMEAADAALESDYQEADAALDVAYKAADTALDAAYKAADAVVNNALTEHKNANGTSVHGLGSAATLTAQTSTTDVTSERVLKVGAYGLGSGAAGTVAYGRGNILGAVSQSGGVPTGAIIYTSTGANGTVTRFADGTQICRHSQTSSSSGEALWTYPLSFASTPTVIGSLQNTNGNLMIGPNIGSTTTSASFLAYADGASLTLVATTVNMIAMGRWF